MLRYTFDLLNITLIIYTQTIHLLKHWSGIVDTPRCSFCLQVLRKEHIGELLIDTSPTGILYQQFGAVCGNRLVSFFY
jgi:hypothetical protein